MSKSAQHWFLVLLLAFGIAVVLGGYARWLDSHEIAGYLLRVWGVLALGGLGVYIVLLPEPRGSFMRGVFGLMLLGIMGATLLMAVGLTYRAIMG